MDKFIASLEENKEKTVQLRCRSPITENDMVIICSALKTNTTLQRLVLSGNAIGVKQMRSLTNVLRVHETIKEVDLSNNNFGPEGALFLSAVFKSNHTIRSMNLYSNNFTSEGISHLCVELLENKSLRYLNLGHNAITVRGVDAISRVLRQNDTLASLDLRCNPLGDDGIKLLAGSLFINKTLTALHLLDTGIGDEGAESLAKALRLNQGLTILKLGRNLIGKAGASQLSQSLKTNENLLELDLGNIEISEFGIAKLAEALAINRTLLNLSLACSSINVGIKKLANSLTINHDLMELNLRDDKIGDDGARHLAHALYVNRGLQSLNLYRNNITDKGCEYLSSALVSNHSLSSLHLEFNSIGDHGARCLADSLKINQTLTDLNLNENNVGDNGAKNISEALLMNNSLITLELARNQISIVGIKYLEAAVSKNFHLLKLKLVYNHVGEPTKIANTLERNKTRKENLLIESLNGAKRTPWNRSRVMFVGKGGVGKTATVRSLLGKPFLPTWDSTVGVRLIESENVISKSSWKTIRRTDDKFRYSKEFATRILQHDDVLGNLKSSVGVQPSDMTKPTGVAQKKDKRKTSIINKLKEGAILIEGKIRMSNATVNKAIRKRSSIFRKQLQNHGTDSVLPVPRLCGTQTESNDQSGVGQELKHFSEPYTLHEFDEKLLFHRKLNQDALSLSLWDFGGQEVFYGIHHIFLTKSGAYVLVFNLREALDSDSMNSQLFWLRSIKLHAPAAPVFLVGTYLHEVSGKRELDRVQTLIKELKDVFPRIVKNNNRNLDFFPIDNSNGYGIEHLRATLESVIRKDHTSCQLVSMQWIVLLDKILARRRNESFLSLTRVRDLANEIGLVSQTEQNEALSLFHDQGMLIHITSTETLKNIVVIKPQWMIDGLCKLIRDRNLHQINKVDIEKRGLSNDHSLLFRQALATQDFLEYIWGNEQVDFFIELMRRTLLLSEWNFQDENYYLIPSLLNTTCQSHGNGLKCAFDFSDSFLPIGVFSRLLCLCVAYSNKLRLKNKVTRRPELYKSFGTVELLPGSIVHLKEQLESQRIILLVENVERAAKCLYVILSMLRKLNCDIMGEGLSWQIVVEGIDGKFKSLDKAQNEKQSPWYAGEVFVSEPLTVDLDTFFDNFGD